MARQLKQIVGRRRLTAETTEDILVIVFAPEPHPVHGVPSCRIQMPALFAEDRRIAGADDAQAVALAVSFVEQLFAYNGIELVEMRDLDPE